jgi:DNA-binding MarR family transcriptional regulator
MQSLTEATKRRKKAAEAVSSEQCARAVLDVAPPVVRLIRRLMTSRRSMGLSVAQFRTLALLSRSPNASLSCVADNIGSSLPAASRMIGVLVGKKLVVRQDSAGDRRQLSLALTPRGAETLKVARDGAQEHLSEKLKILGPVDRDRICQGLELLGEIFGTDAGPILAAAAAKSCCSD